MQTILQRNIAFSIFYYIEIYLYILNIVLYFDFVLFFDDSKDYWKTFIRNIILCL